MLVLLNFVLPLFCISLVSGPAKKMFLITTVKWLDDDDDDDEDREEEEEFLLMSNVPENKRIYFSK